VPQDPAGPTAPGATSSGPIVSGHILVPASVSSFRGARVHVRLEDVSYVDREAVVIGEVTLANIDHLPAPSGTATELAFSIEPTAPITPTHDYSVRAWVNRSGEGIARAGDLRSDRSYRVLTRGFGSQVMIKLVAR
jgi:uncharacterized lipoprotein YbaY